MITYTTTYYSNPDVQYLIQQLDAELWRRHGPGQAQYSPHNLLSDDDQAILSKWEDEPAGYGCLKILNAERAEVKRMFVQPSFRGNGIATGILKNLERIAQEKGVKQIVLETSVFMEEAIALYMQNDYVIMDNYPPYDKMVDSISFMKEINGL